MATKISRGEALPKSKKKEPTKNYKVLPDVELIRTTRGLPVRNPMLSEKQKLTVDVLEAEINSNPLDTGERSFIRFIKRAEKLTVKNKFLFDYEDGIFTFYSELFERENYKELYLWVDEGYYVLEDANEKQLYICEYEDLQEIFDYIIVNYTSKYKPNGSVVLR